MSFPTNDGPSQMKREDFQLDKWYADCVTDTGDTFVAYHGVARWKKLTVRYSSVLTIIGDAPASARYCIKETDEPFQDGSAIRWASRHLNFEGIWEAIDPGYSETLFASPGGVVEWHCLQPRANVEIRSKQEQPVCGLGYVERLRMTIAPWKLPIHELYWGRFLNHTVSLVWIEWRGPFSTRLLLHNGSRIETGEVADNVISFATAGRLTFGERTVLREGKLGAVALKALSTIKKLLPQKILGVTETKWRSRAQLLNVLPSDGWAIHEVVQWPH